MTFATICHYPLPIFLGIVAKENVNQSIVEIFLLGGLVRTVQEHWASPFSPTLPLNFCPLALVLKVHVNHQGEHKKVHQVCY